MQSLEKFRTPLLTDVPVAMDDRRQPFAAPTR
jgi:hypothetical protein